MRAVDPTIGACPVCGERRATRVRESQIHDVREVSFGYTFRPEHSRTFQVARCEACTHVYCSPVPADMGAHYRDVVDEEYLQHTISRTEAAERVIAKLAREGAGRRLLDVGCATGDFVAVAARRGFAAEGLEPSVWSSTIARERGLTIHRAYLEAFAGDHPGAYDAVLLMGVIEHFSDPVAELRHVRRLLVPGGIAVIWTGDVGSLPSRLLGRRWWYWQGQHIQYFTRRSLDLACTRAGLRPERHDVYPFGATYETLRNSLRRYPLHGLLSALIRPAFALKRSWPLYVPGEMLVFARG